MLNIYLASCKARKYFLNAFVFLFLSNCAFSQSDVSVTVSSSAPTYSIYGYITFYVTVKNNGPNAATNVVCNVPQPAGSSNTCNKTDVGIWRNWDTGVWEIGNLNSGDSVNLKTTLYTLTNKGITMTASVVSSNTDPVLQNNTASKTVTAGAAAAHLNCDGTITNTGGGGTSGNSTDIVNLSVTLTCSNIELNYGAFEYFILTIKNSESKAATNVKVQLSIPQGLEIQSSELAGLGSFDNASGIWDIGTVEAYNSHTILVKTKVVQGGNFKCYAQVTACDQTDSNSKPNNYLGTAVEDDEADLNILGLWADLSMKASLKAGSSSQVKVGDNVTFLVTLTNSGPTRADGVKIRSYIPNGMQFVSATTTIGIYDSQLGVWILSDTPDPNNYGNKPGFTIQANTTQTMEVTYKAVQLGTITYDVEVRSCNVPDPNSAPSNFNLAENDEAQVIINSVNQTDPNAANLSLSANVTTAPVNANDSVSVKFVISNGGPATATNVVVKLNALPTQLSTLSFQPSNGNYQQSTNTWNISSLPPNSTAFLTVSGNVGCIGATKIFGQVQSANQKDLASTHGNNTDSIPHEADEAAITINAVTCVSNTPSADLKLTNLILLTPVFNNDSVAFQLVLTNKGPSAANVVVKNTPSTLLGITNFIPSLGKVDTQSTASVLSNLWTINNFAAGATATLTLSGRMSVINKIESNFAQVWTSNQPDPNSTPGNNTLGSPTEDDETIVSFGPTNSVNTNNTLALGITSNPPTYKLYSTDTFRIAVKNNTNSASQNLKITFPFPAKTVTGGAAVPSVGTWSEWCTGGTQCFTWSIPTLAANVTATLDVPLFFQNATGNIIATATISSVSPAITVNFILTPSSFNVESSNMNELSVMSSKKSNDKLLVMRDERKNISSFISHSSSLIGVFPNPAKDEIIINYEGLQINDDSKLVIYNSYGVVMITQTLDSSDNIVKTSVSDLTSGNYFVRIVNSGEPDVIQRFVIMR